MTEPVAPLPWRCDAVHRWFGVCRLYRDHDGPHETVAGNRWENDTWLDASDKQTDD